MLIVKVFVNERQIDEIHIQNVGKDGRDCLYKIRKPYGFELVAIAHRRSKKYYGLLRDALNLILGE